MFAFRLCVILLACHRAGPLPAGAISLPEAGWTVSFSLTPVQTSLPAFGCAPRERELRYFIEGVSRNQDLLVLFFVRKTLENINSNLLDYPLLRKHKKR